MGLKGPRGSTKQLLDCKGRKNSLEPLTITNISYHLDSSLGIMTPCTPYLTLSSITKYCIHTFLHETESPCDKKNKSHTGGTKKNYQN